MKRGLHLALQRAEENLAAARLLLEADHPAFALARAYYAMFTVASAALQTKGLAFSSHQAVMSAFAQHFVKEGIFKKEMRNSLKDLYDFRLAADYGSYKSITLNRRGQAFRKRRSSFQRSAPFCIVS
jgi:uncharacterized protein (UPF0332 family)